MTDNTITLTAKQWRMVQNSMTEFRSVSDGEAGAGPCSHQEMWQCRTDCVRVRVVDQNDSTVSFVRRTKRWSSAAEGKPR